jgi:protein-disulfide isomerase-like protein with CxxC motif
MTKAHALQFHYFFDPLCGWCYASAPALAAIPWDDQLRFRRLAPKPKGLAAN